MNGKRVETLKGSKRAEQEHNKTLFEEHFGRVGGRVGGRIGELLKSF